ncbi:MAG: hypothetical protein ACK551_06530 [Vampirovibrionales bacterium]
MPVRFPFNQSRSSSPLQTVSEKEPLLPAVNPLSKKKIPSPFHGPDFLALEEMARAIESARRKVRLNKLLEQNNIRLKNLEEMARAIESTRRKLRLRELLDKNKIRLDNIELFKIKLYFFIFNSNINSQRNLFLRYYTTTFYILKLILARLIR